MVSRIHVTYPWHDDTRLQNSDYTSNPTEAAAYAVLQGPTGVSGNPE